FLVRVRVLLGPGVDGFPLLGAAHNFQDGGDSLLLRLLDVLYRIFVRLLGQRHVRLVAGSLVAKASQGGAQQGEVALHGRLHSGVILAEAASPDVVQGHVQAGVSGLLPLDRRYVLGGGGFRGRVGRGRCLGGRGRSCGRRSRSRGWGGSGGRGRGGGGGGGGYTSGFSRHAGCAPWSGGGAASASGGGASIAGAAWSPCAMYSEADSPRPAARARTTRSRFSFCRVSGLNPSTADRSDR